MCKNLKKELKKARSVYLINKYEYFFTMLKWSDTIKHLEDI